jgi:ankyrin repeat protein
MLVGKFKYELVILELKFEKIMKISCTTFWKAAVTGLCLFAAATTTRAERPAITPDYSEALRSGDLRRLRQALDQGSDANAVDQAGNTPLMLAAVYGDVDCMRLLIERGASVNAANAAGATPLMRASFDYDKLRLLVTHGADVNARSALGNTPLILAARPANSHKAVELLLSRGADARTTNAFGATALMSAAAGGDDASVRLLLEHGADVNAQPGMTHADFILGGGRSALMWAAFRGNSRMLKTLLDAGANVNGEGFFGTPLEQAAWSDQTKAARMLIARGAEVNQKDHGVGYSPLHWAASSEGSDPSLVKLLLDKGADPNTSGGENVDALMGIPQTPLMLARKRGDTQILSLLRKAGATNETPERVTGDVTPVRNLPARLEGWQMLDAVRQAMPQLQETALFSKQSFVSHASKQDCTSCHQQYLPMAATGFARKAGVPVNLDAEQELIKLVGQSELKNSETDWQPLFHPDAVHTKGYSLFGQAAEELPSNELTDSFVHHLSVIQGKDGRWHNNIPRPPMQSGDISATALAIHALQRYPLPGRKAEFATRVDRARQWLWTVQPENNEGRVFQLLGLAWAGESPKKLQPLAKALAAQQRADGGWSQLPGTSSDAYATGEAVYALRLGAKLSGSDPAIERGQRYLVDTQLVDGTWHVHRRTFPFQPTMKSGFPHGKDSWISAAATSWAVMALSLAEEPQVAAGNFRGH